MKVAGRQPGVDLARWCPFLWPGRSSDFVPEASPSPVPAGLLLPSPHVVLASSTFALPTFRDL